MRPRTWVGGRRWDLNFASGETIALPEGDEAAARAIRKFAKLDKETGLLGRGIVRFDMRIPGKMIVRLPRAPGEPIDIASAKAPPLPTAASTPDAGAGASPRTEEPATKAGALGMAAPTDRKLIAALDIGSSKVCAMIASVDDDDNLTVLGTGQRESRGRQARLRHRHGR